MPDDCLSLFWGHSVHFAIQMLRFQKATVPTVFSQFQPNFIASGHEGIQAITVFGDLPTFKNVKCFKVLV